MEQVTGVSTAYVLETQHAKSEFITGSSATRVGANGFPQSLRSDSSQLEAGVYNDTAPCVPRAAAVGSGRSGVNSKHGMTVDQEIALASLDPRTRNLEPRKSNQRLGVSTSAVANESSHSVPSQGIGISRDWRMYSE